MTMQTFPTLRAAFVLLVLCPGTVLAQQNTERGAVLGGLTGALVGAGIGDHNDNAGAGALIGGAVGLITGAALGNTADEEEQARARALQQQHAYQMSYAVSTADVVMMTRNGVQPEIIINHINRNGVQRRLEVSDVISLHQQGVNEAVISAMQRAPLAASTSISTITPSYQTPVVVEHYYTAPPVRYWGPPPCYRPHPPVYHHHHHHRPGVSWGIVVGH